MIKETVEFKNSLCYQTYVVNVLIKETSLTLFLDEVTTEQTTTEHTSSSMINILANLCNLLTPCHNQGTCKIASTNDNGYNCLCASGFAGIQCEYDYRVCTLITCWNNGRKIIVLCII